MDPKIHIVGNNQLHYELISFCLENELKALCIFQSNLPSDDTDEGESDRQKVWLIDCQDLDGHELEKRLNRFASILPNDAMMALFNVGAEHKPERLIIQYKIRGLFYRFDSRNVFIKGLRTILNNHLWLSRKLLSDCILTHLDQGNPPFQSIKTLSSREKAILKHVAKGASNKHIAEKLCISVSTVKSHLYKIFRKINVSNRLQAAMWINSRMAAPDSPSRNPTQGASGRKSKG